MLGSSGLKVAPLCLGTMNFGHETWGADESTSLGLIDAYLERGGNFLDTANRYGAGRSEEIIGKALKGRREDVVLATKCFFPEGDGPNQIGNTRKNIRDQVEISLRRLDTEYIDLYQIHIYDALTPVEETLSVLTDLVHEGKVHYIGCCNLTGWQLAVFQERADADGYERFVTTQPQYSLVCRDIEHELMPAADFYGVGILPWSPLGFGMLAGKYQRDGSGPAGRRMTDPDEHDIMRPWKERQFTSRNFDIVEAVVATAKELGTSPAALSIAWVLEQPAVSSVILGPRNVEQLDDVWTALELEIPEEAMDRLEEVSDPGTNYLEFMQEGVNARRLQDLE
jgi:aryl-alcohol dehydrogenase-like predicted oxidoreductase